MAVAATVGAASAVRITQDPLAEIVHELCTPLSSVGTAVDRLLEDFDSIDSGEATDLLHRVRDGTRWLQDIVSQLAEAPLVNPEALRLCGAPFNVGHCVRRGISVAKPLLEQRAQRVEVHAPAHPVIVWGDELMIRRVVLNLLSNAAKYAPIGDRIQVRVTPKDGRVVVEVRDHGPGIAGPRRQHLFEPGVRGHSAVEETQGSGLGLSIVKSLVRAHHGRVGVRRASRGGTTFWFTLPRIGARRGTSRR